MNTERETKKVIADFTNYTVQYNRSLGNDLGFDSLDCIEMVMALEKKFDVSLSDETVNHYLGYDWKESSVKDVVHMMQRELEKQKS